MLGFGFRMLTVRGRAGSSGPALPSNALTLDGTEATALSLDGTSGALLTL